MSSKRIFWIDWAKSIGIFLVILGHIKIDNQYLINLIFAFHVPLFFFISGFLESEKNQTLKYVFTKNFKQLIIPYFIFKCLAIPLYIYWNRHELFSNELIYKSLIGFFVGNGIKNDYVFALNPPTWFLFSLFIMKLFFHILRKFFNEFKLLLGSIFFVIIAYISKQYIQNIYFCLDSVFLCFIFFFTGFLFKNISERLDKIEKSNLLLFSLILSFCLFFISELNSRIDVNNFSFGTNLFLFYLGAYSGIFIVICISLFLGKTNFIIEITSKNTLYLLGFHVLLQAFISILLQENFGINNLYSIYSGLLLALFELFFILFIIRFFKKNKA